MSLFYYIIYKAFRNYISGFMNAKFLFVTIQFLGLIALPIFILSELHKKQIIQWELISSERIILSLICLVSIIAFDYHQYFKAESQLKIIQRYTDRYSFIENHPLISFFISFFSFLILYFLTIFL